MSQLYRIYFNVIVYNHILYQSCSIRVQWEREGWPSSNLPQALSFNFTETIQTANVRFKLRLSQNRI